MLLPCSYHARVMLVPCSLPCYRHAHALAMLLSCSSLAPDLDHGVLVGEEALVLFLEPPCSMQRFLACDAGHVGRVAQNNHHVSQ
eukprot:5790197-Heterocapsa_arctica.AAC.1